MKRFSQRRIRLMSGICAGAFMFQLGGCDFGDISTSVTLSTRDLLLNVVRGIILTPLETAITTAIDNVFNSNP